MKETLNNQLEEKSRSSLSGKVGKDYIDAGCEQTNFDVPQWCLCIVQSLCTRSSVLRVPVMIPLKKPTSFDNQYRSTGPFDSDCTEAFASLFQ
jgi:hypothetical protein